MQTATWRYLGLVNVLAAAVFVIGLLLGALLALCAWYWWPGKKDQPLGRGRTARELSDLWP